MSSSSSSSEDSEIDSLLLANMKKQLEFSDTPKFPFGCDSLGFVPALVPIVGVLTMISTIGLSCREKFDCSHSYPTLSYAATFAPMKYVFTIGMSFTACMILSSVLLFGWHLRLHLPMSLFWNRILWFAVIGFGVLSSGSLFTLAVCDMKNYHDMHVVSTIVFFIAAWCTIAACHLARIKVFRQRKSMKLVDPMLESGGDPKTSVFAFKCGTWFIVIGIGHSFIFAFLFLVVNGIWKNPLLFTASQEAFAEFIAIICQLLFIGTLGYEASMLTADIEQQYHEQLMHQQ